MILQVSPLPGSSDQEEYFYDPTANVDCRIFLAAQAFFLAQGHTVTINDCADIAEFEVALPPDSQICPLTDILPALLSQGHAILQAQLASFASLTETSGRSFLNQYANKASSFTETCRSTTSQGIDPPPVSLPASLANATQGSCLSLPVVQELGHSCRPPPPAASRHPVDPVFIDAKSLSSVFSHPDLKYDRFGSRGFPHPIPYGAYHPFTPIYCGGNGHQISINGGGIPFPVPHSIHHGGVTFDSLRCHFLLLGCLPSSMAGRMSLGPKALGSIPMHLHQWHLPSVIRVQLCILCHIRMPGLCRIPTSPSPLVCRVSSLLRRTSLLFLQWISLGCQCRVYPLLRLLHRHGLSLSSLFTSKIQRPISIIMTSFNITSASQNFQLVARMESFRQTLRMQKPAEFGRAKCVWPSRTVPFVFYSRTTRVTYFMAVGSKCLPPLTSIAIPIPSLMLSPLSCLFSLRCKEITSQFWSINLDLMV
jgi:hypothetical protein